jgi:hypothetical protein
MAPDSGAAKDPKETYLGNNTRKLSMAATRAGQRLVISYVGELPEVIRLILSPQPK